MAVARKPKIARPVAESGEDEKAIEALINKGGSIAPGGADTRTDEATIQKTVNVVLRLPPDLAERVAASVDRRPLKTPRHTWLLEAVLEKLNREESK